MEIWKDVPGYESMYQVSSLGNVKSLNYNHTKKEKLMTPGTNQSGYRNITFMKDGKKGYFLVHQLVAMAFMGHERNGHKAVIDHINCNKGDNRVENLRIVSSRENIIKEREGKRNLPIGVCFVDQKYRPKKYIAQINIGGKHRRIGRFFTPEEASAAYQKELQKILENRNV